MAETRAIEPNAQDRMSSHEANRVLSAAEEVVLASIRAGWFCGDQHDDRETNDAISKLHDVVLPFIPRGELWEIADALPSNKRPRFIVAFDLDISG